MNYEIVPSPESDDIDLIDVAVTIAEAWWLLLLGPLIAGGLTAAILLNSQPKYVSQALVRIGWQANTITAPSTIIPVVNKLGLRDQYGPQMDTAIAKVSRRISSGKLDDGLVSITASFPSPQTAQNVLSAVIEEIWRQSIPRDGEKENLESELSSLNESITDLRKYRDTLRTPTSQGNSSLEEEGKTRSLAVLVNEVGAKEDRVRDIKQRLRGLGQENIILAPTLPDRTASRHVAAFSAIAAVGAGLAVLIVIFIRESWRRAAGDPIGEYKLRRIRNAFRFGRKARTA